MGEFWAPGAEIWLFKKKNMDRSIDLAVWHIYITKTFKTNIYSIHSQDCCPLSCFFQFQLRNLRSSWHSCPPSPSLGWGQSRRRTPGSHRHWLESHLLPSSWPFAVSRCRDIQRREGRVEEQNHKSQSEQRSEETLAELWNDELSYNLISIQIRA